MDIFSEKIENYTYENATNFSEKKQSKKEFFDTEPTFEDLSAFVRANIEGWTISGKSFDKKNFMNGNKIDPTLIILGENGIPLLRPAELDILSSKGIDLDHFSIREWDSKNEYPVFGNIRNINVKRSNFIKNLPYWIKRSYKSPIMINSELIYKGMLLLQSIPGIAGEQGRKISFGELQKLVSQSYFLQLHENGSVQIRKNSGKFFLKRMHEGKVKKVVVYRGERGFSYIRHKFLEEIVSGQVSKKMIESLTQELVNHVEFLNGKLDLNYMRGWNSYDTRPKVFHERRQAKKAIELLKKPQIDSLRIAKILVEEISAVPYFFTSMQPSHAFNFSKKDGIIARYELDVEATLDLKIDAKHFYVGKDLSAVEVGFGYMNLEQALRTATILKARSYIEHEEFSRKFEDDGSFLSLDKFDF